MNLSNLYSLDWNPFLKSFGADPFLSLEKELYRALQAVPEERPAPYPALNAWVSEGTVIVHALAPGLDANDLDISVLENTLIIKGERKEEPYPSEAKILRRERTDGKFVRTLELPFPVNADQVEAQYRHGVLTITLPRAEEDKPRKITVK